MRGTGRRLRVAATTAALGTAVAGGLSVPATATHSAPRPTGAPLPVGTVLVAEGSTATQTQLVVLDRRGVSRPFEVDMGEPPSRSQPAVSPDRRRVAWVEAQVGGGLVAPPAASVMVAAADGTGARELVTSAYLPVWAPDNRRLLVSRGGETPASPQPSLWVVDADTGAARRLLPDGGGNAATWSPDGSTIAYTRGTEVWTMTAEGTQQRRLTAGTGPAFSPDGTRIAFRRGPSGTTDLWVHHLPTGEEQRVTATAADERLPAWADGTTLLTTSSAADCPAQAGTSCRHVLVRVDLRTGTVQPVTPAAAADTEGTVTPSYAFPAVALPPRVRSTT